MPKNEEIQKIISEVGKSPSDKVIHMSVINSAENIGETDLEQPQHDLKPVVEEESKEPSSQKVKDKDSSEDKDSSGTKAAVPILDFTNLPPKDKKEEENKSDRYEDFEMGSNSITSAFDHEGRLDLSSKKLQNLI